MERFLTLTRSALVGALILFSSTVYASPPACLAEVTITGALLESNDTVVVCMYQLIQFEDVSNMDGTVQVRMWDMGDGTGPVNGTSASSTSYAYELEGSYTFTMMVETDECTPAYTTRTIVVLGQPLFSTSMSIVDCAGNCSGEAVLTIESDNEPFYNIQWDDPNAQQGDTASDLCAGTYYAVITDDFGCTDLMSSPIDVQEPQPFTATFSTPDTIDLCPENGLTGIPLTIDGGAGNNQSFCSPAINVSMASADLLEFEPNEVSLDQMYTVTVMDNNGCSTQDSVYIRSTPSSLEGYVTMENVPCQNCEVLRYHFEFEAGVWHVLESTFTDATGAFDFGPVENFDKFILMADPEDVAHPMGVETFYPLKHEWSDADVFNMCGDNYYKHVELIPPMAFNGDNTLSGTVWYSASGKTQTEEDPIPLIDVVVEKTPPGQAQGRVATNENGDFEFQYVPSSDTSYTLFVNLPGVPVATTYEILADQGGELFDGLDFCLNIDSTLIDICQVQDPVITGEPTEDDQEDFVLYPNPNNGMFTIETGKFALTPAEIRIVDPAGRLAFRKLYAETPITINMVNIADGFYTVQILNESDMQSSAISVIRD